MRMFYPPKEDGHLHLVAVLRAPLGRGREGGVGRLGLVVQVLVELDALEVEVVRLNLSYNSRLTSRP